MYIFLDLPLIERFLSYVEVCYFLRTPQAKMMISRKQDRKL